MLLSDWFAQNAPRRLEFLARQEMADADARLITEDMSSRRYWRLRKNGRSRVLMESVPDDNPLASPGNRQADFVRLAALLKQNGLSVPDIYAFDAPGGFMLLDDFGDTTFARAIHDGGDTEFFYDLAIDTLTRLNAIMPESGFPLPRYRDSYVHAGRRRIIDWLVPLLRQRVNESGIVPAFDAAWQAVEDRAEMECGPVDDVFLHIDFHAENLMFLPGRDGVAQCGILDFQTAMRGPAPYDLANLIEDPRAGAETARRDRLLARYQASCGQGGDNVAFARWYRVYAAQFHCRVAGQYVKLAFAGKARYLDFLPTALFWLRQGLADPALAPLAAFFTDAGINLAMPAAFDPAARGLVTPDAS